MMKDDERFLIAKDFTYVVHTGLSSSNDAVVFSLTFLLQQREPSLQLSGQSKTLTT